MFKQKSKVTPNVQPRRKKRTSFGKQASTKEEKPEVCLSIPAKFYGQLPVTEPRSDAACETALALIKARLIAPKTHKPRVVIELMPNKFVVKRSNQMTPSSFAYTDMVYIWSDPADSRSCGLVFRKWSIGECWYEFHGYKMERGPSRLIGALKHIFLNLPTVSLSDTEEQKLSAEQTRQKTKIGNKPVENSEPKTDAFVRNLLDLEEKLDGSTNSDKSRTPWTSIGDMVEEDEDAVRRQSSWTKFDDPFEIGCSTPEQPNGQMNWQDFNRTESIDPFVSRPVSQIQNYGAQLPAYPTNQWTGQSRAQPVMNTVQWTNMSHSVPGYAWAHILPTSNSTFAQSPAVCIGSPWQQQNAHLRPWPSADSHLQFSGTRVTAANPSIQGSMPNMIQVQQSQPSGWF